MTEHFSTSSFIAGVMLGALLVGAWYFGTSPEALSPASTTLPALKGTPLSESGAVSVTDQPSGESVIIESITVPPPGVWVAVREVNGADLGNVLGAARVVGPHSSVVVPLLRPTESARVYAVELYRDDNNGAFAPAINSVYVDFDTGTRVVSYFTTAP
ncbi:MAG: hypothetical protein NUV60_02925 [Patescibacteria group bacterium]|nr:hypothetical protein [Patescibacteria group bacterium]